MGDHTLSDQRFLYRGYQWDDTLKMYHVRHRVYDPARMLWIQRDPLGRIPGVNEYAYCLGEPVDRFDPMGLDWLDDAIHFGTGAADVLSFGLSRFARDQTGVGSGYIDYSSGYYEAGAVTGAVAATAVTMNPAMLTTVGITVTGTTGATAAGALIGGYVAGGISGASGTGVDGAQVAAGMVGGAVGGQMFGSGTQLLGRFGGGAVSAAGGDLVFQTLLVLQGKQQAYSPQQTLLAALLGGTLTRGLVSKAEPQYRLVYDGSEQDAALARAAEELRDAAQAGRAPKTGTGCPDAPEVGAENASKVFSKEKKALVDMAKGDKRTGMTEADMEAYKQLNRELPDPFPGDAVRGPESHPNRGPHAQQPHGHVGPVDHIPITDVSP